MLPLCAPLSSLPTASLPRSAATQPHLSVHLMQQAAVVLLAALQLQRGQAGDVQQARRQHLRVVGRQQDLQFIASAERKRLSSAQQWSVHLRTAGTGLTITAWLDSPAPALCSSPCRASGCCTARRHAAPSWLLLPPRRCRRRCWHRQRGPDGHRCRWRTAGGRRRPGRPARCVARRAARGTGSAAPGSQPRSPGRGCASLRCLQGGRSGGVDWGEQRMGQ